MSYHPAWTTPAADLPVPTDQRAARAWLTRGRGAQWKNPALPPRLALAVQDWAWNGYRARLTADELGPATPTVRVWRSPDRWEESGYYRNGPTAGQPVEIPWHPTWRPATGGDRGAYVDLPDGRPSIELLNLRAPNPLQAFLIAWATAVDGDPGQYRDGDLIADAVGFGGDFCGGGGPKRPGILTAADVRSGRVMHALSVAGLTQYGPGARIVGPVVNRVEHRTAYPGCPVGLLPGDNASVVPAGTRFHVPMDGDDIAAMLRAAKLTGQTASTAAIVARCLSEFGFYHGTDTGVGDPVAPTDGTPGNWGGLGVASPAVAASLLDHVPWQRLRVIGP